MREKRFYVHAELHGIVDVIMDAPSKRAVREQLKEGVWRDSFNIDFAIVGQPIIQEASDE